MVGRWSRFSAFLNDNVYTVHSVQCVLHWQHFVAIKSEWRSAWGFNSEQQVNKIEGHLSIPPICNAMRIKR